MKLKELRNIDPPSTLPKLKSTELELLWESDRWDGPMSGMLRYRNDLYWFDATQECENWTETGWYRRYGVVKLSQSQLEKELEVHKDFERWVGTHGTFIHLSPPPKFEEGKFDTFYNTHLEYCQSQHFEENELIGWMER